MILTAMIHLNWIGHLDRFQSEDHPDICEENQQNIVEVNTFLIFKICRGLTVPAGDSNLGKNLIQYVVLGCMKDV